MPRKPAQELGVLGKSEATTPKKLSFVTAAEVEEGQQTKWPREEGFGSKLRELFTIFNVYQLLVFPCSRMTEDKTFANTKICCMWFKQTEDQPPNQGEILTKQFKELLPELGLTVPKTELTFTDTVKQSFKTARTAAVNEVKLSMQNVKRNDPFPGTTLLQETYMFHETASNILMYQNPCGANSYVYADITSTLQPALKKQCTDARYVRAMTFKPIDGMFGPVSTSTVVPEQPFAAYSNIMGDIQALRDAEDNAINFRVSPDDLQSIKRGLEIMMRAEIDQEGQKKIQETITRMGPTIFTRVLELAQMVHRQIQGVTNAVCTLAHVADRNQTLPDELPSMVAGAIHDQQRLLLLASHQVSQLAEKAAQIEQETRQLTAYTDRSKTSVDVFFKLLGHEARRKKLDVTSVSPAAFNINKEDFIGVLITMGDLATTMIQSWVEKEPARKEEFSALEACVAVWKRMARGEDMAARSTSPTHPPPPA
jgi:hypothetical protein